jgi:hypothetical protein
VLWGEKEWMRKVGRIWFGLGWDRLSSTQIKNRRRGIHLGAVGFFTNGFWRCSCSIELGKYQSKRANVHMMISQSCTKYGQRG